MNSVELTKYVEDRIKVALLIERMFGTENYAKLKLHVYQKTANKLREVNVVLTTGFFNRVVADMKRTGIIGTLKGGDYIFLTDACWKMLIEDGDKFVDAIREQEHDGVGDVKAGA